MHRKIASQDVEDYATHIPGDVADMDKEEDMVYTKGVLMHANGVSQVKMMPEVRILHSIAPTKLKFA